MNKNAFYLLAAIALAFYLLAPGVWWGDTLNCYIHGVSGKYGSAQPVLIDILLNISRSIYPGPLLLFSVCVVGYFTGFYLMVFGLVKHRVLAPVLFFLCSFYPSLFANIGVVQTEALQLAALSLIIPLTILMYRTSQKWRVALFVLLGFLLGIFSLVRYDTLHIVLLIAYWMCFSFYRKHGVKPAVTAIILLVCFYLSGLGLKAIVGLSSDSDKVMRSTLLVTDLAAISAESNENLIPDYCWQSYLPKEERSVEKMQYGLKEWRNSFYSYIYNIDPKVGLFTYNIKGYEDDLESRWRQAIIKHPFNYLKYHLLVFGYLLDNDNYNMGLWGGLKDSHTNHARIEVEQTPQVDSFVNAHKGRFVYQDGYLILEQDDKMISDSEEEEIKGLVESRRASDATWMKWYSQIPRSVYMLRNDRAEKYILPFTEWLKGRCRWLCCIFPFAFILVVCLLFVARRIRDKYLRFTFIIICLCGIIHLGLRALVITDPVFRFGILSILLAFYLFPIIAANAINPTDNEG